MADDLIAEQLTHPDQYTFFVPEEAHWSKIRHLKTNVGTALNKALEALEDANVDALEDVLKGINFNRKIGQRTLDDDTLSNFIQNFEKIPLRDENFEFPDLLGAAYEYLIKFFADSRLRAQIRATVNSGGRDVANSAILNRLRFVQPSLDEQDRIADRVRALDSKGKAEMAHRDILIKQKLGLMHDLPTGRVRVKVDG